MVFEEIMIDSMFALPVAQTGIRKRTEVTTPGFERKSAPDLSFKFFWRRNLPVLTYNDYMNGQEVQTDIYIKTVETPEIEVKDLILIDDAFGVPETYIVIGGLDLQNGFTRLDLQWQENGSTG